MYIYIHIEIDRWIDRERYIYIYRYAFPPVSPSFLEFQRWSFTPKSFPWPGPLWQYLQVFGMLLVGTVEVLEDHGTSADLGGCAVLPCCHRSFNTWGSRSWKAYPLGMTKRLLLKIVFSSGFAHWKWWLSIVFLYVYHWVTNITRPYGGYWYIEPASGVNIN